MTPEERQQLEGLCEEASDELTLAENEWQVFALGRLDQWYRILDHRAQVLCRAMFALAVLITGLGLVPFGWGRVLAQLFALAAELLLFWVLTRTVKERARVRAEMVLTLPVGLRQRLAFRGPLRMRDWARRSLGTEEEGGKQ